MAIEALNSLDEAGAPLRSASDPGSSHVRVRDDIASRAERRVAEYFRALGLNDAERLGVVSHSVVTSCERQRGTVTPESAVELAQKEYRDFCHSVFGQSAGSVDPLWLRAFFEARPDAFLADVEHASAASRQFGDPFAGMPPTQAQFRDQYLRPARIPRWLLGLLLPAVLTCAAGGVLITAMLPGGLALAEVAWVTLFCFLFGASTIGFCTAGLGLVLFVRKKTRSRAQAAHSAPLPRTALVMPIYHESAEHVFAAIAAMRESLSNTPGGDAFEIFVLSDSRDPECAAEEERAFRRVASSGQSIPVYYRRRARNDRQKAGNLAEFFERWGKRYTYAIVLDADSLMRSDTMVELVRRMEAAPSVALLQAPLDLHRGATWFARSQQFAGSVSGPLFTRGLAAWADGHGNYYGHNAILRVRAFLECCALPVLAGEPPLGGHILSHDFVEAALLCRAGWEVRMAHDLEGSLEELPPTLPEYVARDRRWCQGNLQHLRIAFAEGLAPMSRVHMLVGAASYLAGPVWVLFVALGVYLSIGGDGPLLSPQAGAALIAATATVLLGPRVFGLVAALSNPARRKAHGGSLRLTVSCVLETLFSALLAPVLMLHHARIVLAILIGKAVRWGSQRRRASGELMTAMSTETPATLLGGASAVLLAYFAPGLLLPLSPVWLPLLVAIPLSLAASSVALGRLLKRLGLLLVPAETEPDEIALRADDLRALTLSDESARFRDLILDPLLVRAQIERVNQKGLSKDLPDLLRLRHRALRAGPAALTSAERAVLTSDAETLSWLHEQAWQHWPVESWDIAREAPLLPPESE